MGAADMPKRAKVIHVYANRVWCESDFMGDRHVVVQSDAPGSEPFTVCTLRYSYLHCDNFTGRATAERIAEMFGATQPIEWRLRPLPQQEEAADGGR